MSYATLAQAQQEKKVSSSLVIPDANLIVQLNAVTERIDLENPNDWRFEPVFETRFYDAYDERLDRFSDILWLEAPLLEATTVIDSDETTLTEWDRTRGTRSTADYEVLPVHRTPYTRLRRINAGWASPTAGSFSSITVEGFWGWRQDYATQGFLDSQDQLAAELLDSASTMTVANTDGNDIFGVSPRFSEGQLIRIENEFLRIISINSATVAGVLRGVNGTTSVTHADSTQIDTFYPDRNIVRAAVRWSTYLLTRMGNFETFSIDGFSAVQMPADMPQEMKNIMDSYPSLIMPRRV